jgi:hypothetical protein
VAATEVTLERSCYPVRADRDCPVPDQGMGIKWF